MLSKFSITKTHGYKFCLSGSSQFHHFHDMAAVDGEDAQRSLPHESAVVPSIHPNITYPVYFLSRSVTEPENSIRSKRRQVKNACCHCQKACKKCDDARPCMRCVKYGVAEECVDSQRKVREKVMKRGPYNKKRDGKGGSILSFLCHLWSDIA